MDDLEAALASDDPAVLRAALRAAQAALRQARAADQQACRYDELVPAAEAVEAAAASKVGGGGGCGSPALVFSLEQLQASLGGAGWLGRAFPARKCTVPPARLLPAPALHACKSWL